MRRRVAALAAAAPLLLTGPAQAQSPLTEIVRDILTGCYGAVVTVCHPRVTSNPVDLNSTPVEVCTGTCETYDLPGPSGEPLCVTYADSSGASHTRCSRVDL